MKKLFALLLVSLMILALVACSSEPAKGPEPSKEPDTTEETPDEPDTPDEPEEPADQDITVAGIVFQDDQFMNMLTKGYVDAAADAGVKILTDNTNNDQAKETELINTYLGQGVDGLAIAPLSGDASVAALRSADEQGMKIALTNIDLTDAEFIVAGYTSDNYTNCYLVGQEAAKIIKEKHGDDTVKIAIVQFKSLLPDQSTDRVDGYLKALDEGGVKYEIVADQDAWMQDTALETTSAILTAHPETQVVITVNDGGTIGSVMAVQNAGLANDVMVFGHDGSDQISSMILDDASPLKAIVAQDPYGQGYQAMTALINAVKGGDYSDTKGKCEFIDGIVMSVSDKAAVNAWRVDNGFDAID
ncbi:MAG: substrate-binding domain-containing protein [Clostridiales bacterium]|nr:substrate-binding domain-containing protein [Clostridiales bacterium]